MKVGKVFEKLQANKKVKNIDINEDGAKVTLNPGYANNGNVEFLCANAKEANTFILGATAIPEGEKPVAKPIRDLSPIDWIETPADELEAA